MWCTAFITGVKTIKRQRQVGHCEFKVSLIQQPVQGQLGDKVRPHRNKQEKGRRNVSRQNACTYEALSSILAWNKLAMMVHICNCSTGEREVGISKLSHLWLQSASLGYMRPCLMVLKQSNVCLGFVCVFVCFILFCFSRQGFSV